jgi:trehalose 6-phosphate phosphatase
MASRSSDSDTLGHSLDREPSAVETAAEDETHVNTMTTDPGPAGAESGALPNATAEYAFFLDVDGTLLGLRARPDQVVCSPAVRTLLTDLQRAAKGAVALISGRQIATLDEIFAPLRLPTAGLHGAERRNAVGEVERILPPPKALAAARRLATEVAHDLTGVLFEDKGTSLALHYRAAPAAEEPLRRQLEAFVAGTPEFGLQHGKMVWELRPRGCDKGRAIEAFLAEPPFATRTPVFAGDDVTDEDGFRLVNERGGYSIHVGESVTVARYQVASRDEILEWLAKCAQHGADGMTTGGTP